MLTLVTGLWDIKRESLTEGWSRSFDHYKEKFAQLLKVENNLIIFGEPELESFVWEHRKKDNTQFIVRNQSWFVNNEYYPKIQQIRNNPEWYNQVGWLKDSTQAKLEMYNPLVMSKVFLLNDARILDKFNSEYMFWIDAGLTNTVHQGYFTHDKVLEKLPKYINNLNFVCFPYETNSEIHGFKIDKMNEYCGVKVNMVSRGGFFGGLKTSIETFNNLYYGLLIDTLNKGLMGTEESLFTILLYRYPEFFSYSEIDGNGLMGKFFEDLKNDKVIVKQTKKVNLDYVKSIPTLNTDKVGLYVITFNSPKQFETLIQSMLDYDPDFINKTKKFLLDNSTDLSTTPRYIELCEQYGFEHIKRDNLGICGGRQFVSDHFNNSDLEVMVWSEDDMFFQNKPNETCKNGFNRYTSNLYKKCLDILKNENFDFLKLNFTEYYGDNSTCWPWYNVPQDFRQKHWPNKPKLPTQGLDPNAPLSDYKNIKSYKGLPYATGEIYYCNWTHFITKEGNKKMFQETKWDRVHEQTWMSYIYQETIKGKIKSGLLLLTPIDHNRFDHYSAELRKES
jgi:hypothetical protein